MSDKAFQPRRGSLEQKLREQYAHAKPNKDEGGNKRSRKAHCGHLSKCTEVLPCDGQEANPIEVVRFTFGDCTLLRVGPLGAATCELVRGTMSLRISARCQ